MRGENRQHQGCDHKNACGGGGEFTEKAARSSRPKHRLARPPKRRPDASPFASLQQDDHDQGDGDNDMYDN
jgi:hypothetical protein